MIVIEKVLFVVTAAESSSSAVKVRVPAEAGVPLMTPLEARESPVGSDPPIRNQVYGGVPPDPDNVCEYAEPTVPRGRGELVVMFSAGGLIVIPKVRVAVPELLSVTSAVKLEVAADRGVPVIAPPCESESPDGSEPALVDQVYGGTPPTADKVDE